MEKSKNKYQILVVRQVHIVVEAATPGEAKEVARRAEVNYSNEKGYLLEIGEPEFLHDSVGLVRLSTYTCDHCGEQRLKADWGPGRITCPACGKVAPSPSESAG